MQEVSVGGDADESDSGDEDEVLQEVSIINTLEMKLKLMLCSWKYTMYNQTVSIYSRHSVIPLNIERTLPSAAIIHFPRIY